MVGLDGSYGEGGGQIVRTAVGLSAYLGVPCRIRNIRKGRSSPGLRPQHVAGIRALLELCKGEAEGLRVGSEELAFYPGPIEGGSLRVKVGTAGAIGLVLQTLMLPALKASRPLRVSIVGGTDVPWAPTAGFVKGVVLPVLQEMGYRGELRIRRRGYYPKGGGEGEVRIEGGELSGVELTERGEVKVIRGRSHAQRGLSSRRVAERQREEALRVIEAEGMRGEIEVEYSDALSPGSGLDLWAICRGSRLGCSSLGALTKRAEEVGREAAEGLLGQLASGAALDEWMADQILPFLAVAEGRSSVTVSRITEHFRTNLWVIGHFTERKISYREGERGWLLEVT